jgi:NADH:ubiquinone oxidoreductase subunit C
LFSMLGVIAKGGVGISSGFFFYESTIWLKKKKQKEQTPFFYNLQTINIFNNIRWVFIDEFTTTQIHSNSSAMPASVWPERELQDMYTVNFYGLQDTRRLLLDYKTVRGVLSPNLKISGLNHYSSFYDLYYI